MTPRPPAAAIGRLAAALVLVAGVALPASGQSGNFGWAGAVAGRDVFVGQPANWYGPGVVYLYRADSPGRWREAARLLAPDSARGDEFGRSLAADGRLLLVGAPGRGDGAGAVHLYRRQTGSNGAWEPAASIDAPEGDAGGRFGTVVAIQGDVAFVGAPGADRVVQLSAGERLVSLASLRAVSLPSGSGFGSALSVEGDLLLVGAPAADSNAGAAVVYRRQPSGEWREDGVLSVRRSPGQPPARAGTAVLLAGGRAFVAAPAAAGGVGAVLVYDRDSASAEWSLAGELLPFDGTRGSGFGAALAGTRSELWVGAPDAAGRDGTVYRFAADGTRGWTGVDRLRADSAGTAAWPFGFGSSIAIGSGVAVIGMPQRDFGEGRAVVLTEGGGGWRAGPTVMGEIFRVGSPAGGTECAGGKLGAFDCSNVELVSFIPVDQLGGARGVWVNDVWGWSDPETGRDYALVSRRDGAAFVDVTEPARPRLVGTLARTAGSRPSVWRDIKVYRNHAFVVSDGAGAHGMQVFDLTRLRSATGAPIAFTEDARYDRIHSAHNVVADTASGFLFIVGANGGGETCGGGLHLVDARDPRRPAFAGCYTDRTGARARGYTHDAQCVTYGGPDGRYRGREICVGSNESEINIADVTDKSRPVTIGRGSYPNVAYAHQGWFDPEQRYFYMGDEGDEIAGLVPGTRTIVWDLSRLDDPIVAREYIGPVQATDHNLFVKGDRVYMSNYGSGLRVLDISDREDPREVAFFDSAPVGQNEAGTSATASGAWSNYPFFESGVVVFTSVREGLFIVRVKPIPLVP